MASSYNAKLSFKGDGNFTFTLPRYGELTIYAGRDIYIKGLDVNGVELLRQLRPLMLEHQLNAKPDGCYKVIEINGFKEEKKVPFERAYKEPAPQTVADLKASLIKSNGPIIEEPTDIKGEKEIESKEKENIQVEPEKDKTTQKPKTTGTKAKTGTRTVSKGKKKTVKKTTKK